MNVLPDQDEFSDETFTGLALGGERLAPRVFRDCVFVGCDLFVEAVWPHVRTAPEGVGLFAAMPSARTPPHRAPAKGAGITLLRRTVRDARPDGSPPPGPPRGRGSAMQSHP